jgi:hypothetical protein
VYALKQQQTTLFRNQDAPLTHRIFTRMKSWVSDFF